MVECRELSNISLEIGASCEPHESLICIDGYASHAESPFEFTPAKTERALDFIATSSPLIHLLAPSEAAQGALLLSSALAGLFTPAYAAEETRERLIGSGFRRIGDSSLYRNGKYIVRLNADGTIHPFTDFYPGKRVDEIEGIRKGSAVFQSAGRTIGVDTSDPSPVEKSTLLFITKRGLKNVVADIDRTHYDLKKMRIGGRKIAIQGIKSHHHYNMEAQLKKAGFEELEPGLFSFHFDSPGESPESQVLAFVEKGRIEKILRPARRTLMHDTFYLSSLFGEALLFRRMETVDRCDEGDMCEQGSLLVMGNEWGEIAFDLNYNGRSRGFKRYNSIRSSLEPVSFKLFHEFTPHELGIAPSSKGIDKSLNGEEIRILEGKMRPGGSLEHGEWAGLEKRGDYFEPSSIGFLNANESLRTVLQNDDEYVRSRGLTHHDLAVPLDYFHALYRRLSCNEIAVSGQSIDVTYKGRSYRFSGTSTMGCQYSPFNDGVCTRDDITVTNLHTGKSFTYSAMLPHLIERYGFYEGHTDYRSEPADIIEVFELE